MPEVSQYAELIHHQGQSTETNSSRYSLDDQVDNFRREIYVFGRGIVSGVITEAATHPEQTVAQIASTVAFSTALAAVAAAEIPLVSTAAIATGAVMGGQYAWNLIDPYSSKNVNRNQTIRDALLTAWRSKDPSKVESAADSVAHVTGKDALNLITGAIAGGVAYKFAPLVRDSVSTKLEISSRYTPAYGFLKPTSSELSSQPGIPTWEDFVNYSRRHGPVITRSISDLEVEQAAKTSSGFLNDAGIEAVNENGLSLSKLKTSNNLKEVKDSGGKVYGLDETTGELSNQKLGAPNGPEANRSGTVRPAYFVKF